MCLVCGCGEPDGGRPDHLKEDPKDAPQGAIQGTPQDGPVVDAEHGDLHFGRGAARAHVPGVADARLVQLGERVLGANDRLAAANRAHFAAHGVTALNLLSSPGSGKTSLLVATLKALQQHAPARPLAVIEGDQQTRHDAERIRATGVPAIQVNTGQGCHLDAGMVAAAFARLPLHGHAHGDHAHGPEHAHASVDGLGHGHGHGHEHAMAEPALLFIENVGNLVCPALWDLGEAAKVVLLSVTEGEDKPLKYPDMFAAADLLLLSKTDLLPHLDFDVEQCIAHAHRIRPGLPVLKLSARSGDGMAAWLDWLQALRPGQPPGPAAESRAVAPAKP